MFCTDILKNNAILRPAWNAAYNFKPPSTYNTPLPKTCEVLDIWIQSNHKRSNKRLSLRTSATLIAGTAKLYKQAVDKLFDDVQKLEKELRENNSRKRKATRKESTVSSEDEQSTSSETSEDIQATPPKKRKIHN